MGFDIYKRIDRKLLACWLAFRPRIMNTSEVAADMSRSFSADAGDLSDTVQQTNEGQHFLDLLKSFAEEAHIATKNIAEARDDEGADEANRASRHLTSFSV